MDKNPSAAELIKRLKSDFGLEEKSVKISKNTDYSSDGQRSGFKYKQNHKNDTSARKRSDSSRSLDLPFQTSKSYMTAPKKCLQKRSSAACNEFPAGQMVECGEPINEFEAAYSIGPKQTRSANENTMKKEKTTEKRHDSFKNINSSSVKTKSYMIPPTKTSLGHSDMDEEPTRAKNREEVPRKLEGFYGEHTKSFDTRAAASLIRKRLDAFGLPKPTISYLIPRARSPSPPSTINNPVKKELTIDDIWVENEVDYNIQKETEPSIQVLPNGIQNFDLQKKSDKIRSGRLESAPESTLEKSSGNEKEFSEAQTWVAKCNQSDFKISSETESLVQVLPSKVQGLDFTGPKYSVTRTAECVADNSNFDETEDQEEEPFQEKTQLEFMNCLEILCEGIYSNNPFRVMFGETHIKISIDDSKLNELINKVKSSRNLRDLSLTQMWAMLKVFEVENVIFVETPSVLSLLIYIIPMIAKTTKNEKLNGPSNIILASNIQMVAKIERIVKHFSDHKLYTLSYYGDDLDSSFEEKFAVCDFVISTPKYFMKLFEIINPDSLSKLNTVAFDSIHSMNDISHEEIYELIKKLVECASQGIMQKVFNIVMTSEFWNKNLEALIQSSIVRPILFLACPLQAAICSKIKVFLQVLENPYHKLQLCSTILKSSHFSRRIILCSSMKEMAAIEMRLKSFLNIVTIRETKNLADVKSHRGKEPLNILCPEAMLPELKIDDADFLIIFSIFSSLKDSFSVFQSHLNKEPSPDCCCIVFIDEKSDFELTNMISNLDIKKPILFENILKSAKEAYEMSKLDVPFCEKLIQFGKCSMELSCPKRHILDADRDGNKTRLNQKRVLLDIVKVYDATHYYGKVTCQFNGDQLTESDMKVFTEYRENCRALAHFLRYSSVCRRKFCKRPQIGDQVVVCSEEPDLMERGEIVNILRRDKNLVPIAVSVFTESGHIIPRNVDEIYDLPPKFKNLPVQSVSIILGDIVPADSSCIWSPNVTSIAENNLIGQNPDGPHKTLFTANIKLAIGNIIVVDDIICVEKRNGLELNQKFCLSEKLLASKYAISDRNIIMNLMESCTKAGFKTVTDGLPIAEISEEVEINHPPRKENEVFLKKIFSFSKINDLCSYLDDDLPITGTVSSSNFEDKETKNVGAAAEASNVLNEETDDVQVAPEALNGENEETENTEENVASSIGTPSEDHSGFEISEDNCNKNMNFEALFMKMLGVTLNEMKGTDELSQFLSPDVSSDDLKLENEISACEKLDFNASTTEETQTNENKTEIENSQTSQNEETLKTDEETLEINFNPNEQKCNEQMTVDDVQVVPNNQLDCEDFTSEKNEDEIHKSGMPDECGDKQTDDRSSYLSPKVYWRQKDDVIWARIMVLDVKDYEFKVCKNSFTFRADVNEKVYSLSIKTFAPIVPESFKCNVTGQCVEVKFEGAFKGFEWPRLTYVDNGGSQIKRDPNFFEEDDSCLPLSDQILLLGEKRRKLKEEFGIVDEKPKDEVGYVHKACGAPPDCDLDSDSDDSECDIMDPNRSFADLHDFF